MKLIHHLAFSMLFLLANNLQAQTTDLLNELPGKNREAFVKSEPQLMNTITFLESTPINEQQSIRKKQSALLIAWLTNSPTVSVTLYSFVTKISKVNPDLLVIFMAGYTRYSIENSYSNDPINCNLAGLKTVIAFYKGGNGLTEDKEIEKLIKLEDKGELEKWLKKELSKKK